MATFQDVRLHGANVCAELVRVAAGPVLSAALLAPLAASAADFTATWAVSDEFGRDHEYALLCVLKSNGPAVTGPCASTKEASRPATGRTDGKTVTFHYHTDFNGSGVHLVYSGLVQPDGKVTGKVSSDGSEGVFQAEALTGITRDGAVTWKVDAAFSETLRYVALCTFRTRGERLSGPCTLIDVPSMVAAGTTNGVKIAFHYDARFKGQIMRVDYAGILQHDGTLSGVVQAGGTTGTFTAVER
jgi:hypothetical protein